jgi:hypothetical protein
MPNVAFKRPELKAREKEYETLKDCISGSVAVKAAGTTYLPKPNAEDASRANKVRYNNYLMRAVFYNVTKRTVAGLVGQMFYRDPVIEVPQQLEAIVEDTTGEGVSLVQQAKKVANWVLPLGRAGLFIDYPKTDGNVTVADLETKGIQPTIKPYEPWRIINWRTKKRGALSVLSLVVLEEDYVTSDDGFEMKLGTQWRVLKLTAGPNEVDVYSVEVWRKTDGTNFRRVDVAMPLNGAGQPFSDIPFVFIGSENNDSDVDNPPMYDLADLNIGHYRNSADYEEAAFIVGQPTPVVSGVSQEWADRYFKGGVGLGSRAVVPLPVGGKAELLQAAENTLPFTAMEHKERQMVALGAKLAEQKQVQRTATEASQEEAGEQSVLATVAGNVSLAFEWALGWCCEYIGIDDTDVKFEVNTDFELTKMTPAERQQTVAEWQAEAITFSEMRAALRKGGPATLTDEEAEAELRNAIPLPTQPGGERDPNAAQDPDEDDEGDEGDDTGDKPPAKKPAPKAK